MGSDMTSHSLRGSARESTTSSRFRRSQERAAAASTDVRLTLPARADSLSVIRHVLGAFAEALRLPPDLVEDMRLAVTEACTNVVRHAYDADKPGTIDVVVRPSGGRLEIIVSDRGRGMAPSTDVEGPGLGLPLISALADEVELQQATVRGSRLRMSFECRPRLGIA
jgi:anti-sigma regulatory factor (Ser/Thr protein kinase)